MPRDARVEGFSRRHRFTTQGSFGAILRNSRKLRSTLAVLHIARGAPGASRLGVAIGRRFVPSSLDRNRIKRLLRECFRKHAVKRSGHDVVVALRGRYDRGDEAAMVEQVRSLFDRVNEVEGR